MILPLCVENLQHNRLLKMTHGCIANDSAFTRVLFLTFFDNALSHPLSVQAGFVLQPLSDGQSQPEFLL